MQCADVFQSSTRDEDPFKNVIALLKSLNEINLRSNPPLKQYNKLAVKAYPLSMIEHLYLVIPD